MQPHPAVADLATSPPFDSLNETSRRIVRTVGLYRAACATVLFTLALVLDLRAIHVVAPNAFVAAAGLYFVYGLTTLVWLQRSPLPLPLAVLVSSLLAGDVLFIVLMTTASGTGAPLPILLFPQLAASGWLLRARTAFFHAALATVVLLGLDVWRLVDAQISAAQPFQTGLIGFGYFATIGIAVALGSYAKASRTWQRSAASTSPISNRSIGSSSRICRMGYWSSIAMASCAVTMPRSRVCSAGSDKCAAGCGSPNFRRRSMPIGSTGTTITPIRRSPFGRRPRSDCSGSGWCRSGRASTAAR
jgi:hypothetical protein